MVYPNLDALIESIKKLEFHPEINEGIISYDFIEQNPILNNFTNLYYLDNYNDDFSLVKIKNKKELLSYLDMIIYRLGCNSLKYTRSGWVIYSCLVVGNDKYDVYSIYSKNDPIASYIDIRVDNVFKLTNKNITNSPIGYIWGKDSIDYNYTGVNQRCGINQRKSYTLS